MAVTVRLQEPGNNCLLHPDLPKTNRNYYI